MNRTIRNLLTVLPVVLAAGCPLGGDEEWLEVEYVDEGNVCGEAMDGVLTLSVTAPGCMSSSCSQNLDATCSASSTGTELTLQSDIRWENNVSNNAMCTDDCGFATATCTVGSLTDGTYTLDFDGESYTFVIVDGALEAEDGCYF